MKRIFALWLAMTLILCYQDVKVLKAVVVIMNLHRQKLWQMSEIMKKRCCKNETAENELQVSWFENPPHIFIDKESGN